MKKLLSVCAVVLSLFALVTVLTACDSAKQESVANQTKHESKETLDYKVKDGAFVTSEGIIPQGCFGQLMTELNGDDSVAAIFLNRTTMRGCIDANDTFPGGEEDEVSYDIVKNLGDETWNLRICQIVHGSIRETCSNVTVKFVNRKYIYKSKDMDVLSLEKLGEWSD